MGDKYRNCLGAVSTIGRIPGSTLRDVSGWYLTKPVGVEGQDWFLNGVVSLQTDLPARELLDHLLSIEIEMGRVREERWAPRTIDLDILIFGTEMIHNAGLKVPHPLMHRRRFVLVPMVQVDPDLIHPSLGMSMSQLLRGLPEDDQMVIPFKDKRCCEF